MQSFRLYDHVEQTLFRGRSKLQLTGICSASGGLSIAAVWLVTKSMRVMKMQPAYELLTVSMAMQALSFWTLLRAMRSSYSCDGISASMVGIFLAAGLCRLAGESHAILGDTMCNVPQHFGEQIYQPIEVLTIAFAAYALYCIKFRFAEVSMESSKRELGLGVVTFLLAAAAVAAYYTTVPNSCRRSPFRDWCSSASCWLEAVALLPQLYIVAADGGTERLTSQFIAGMFVAKAFSAMFWATYFAQYDEFRMWGGIIVGMSDVFASHFVSLLSGVDYMYHFVSSMHLDRMEAADISQYRV